MDKIRNKETSYKMRSGRYCRDGKGSKAEMVWTYNKLVKNIKAPVTRYRRFVSERHQFKVFSSLVCSYNFSYLKLLFNYVILS